MPQIVEAVLQHVTFGRKVHRELSFKGVRQIGTTRCLSDDDFSGVPRYVDAQGPREDRGDGLPVGFDDSTLCLWCFPTQGA